LDKIHLSPILIFILIIQKPHQFAKSFSTKEFLMCFSAEASFTAAGALAIIGGATLKNVLNRNYFFLAAIPLLFALQQLSEGVLWVQLGHGHQDGLISNLAARSFLVFAFFVWPIWIPLSLFKAEKMLWRRRALLGISIAGALLSFTNLYFAMDQNISVSIINHSLQYAGRVPPQTILYPLIVVTPIFISSMNKVWIFGVLISIAYIVTAYLYETTFVSVWCFFAAIVSLILYKVLKDNETESENTAESLKEKH
jgi:hypothetical protein